LGSLAVGVPLDYRVWVFVPNLNLRLILNLSTNTINTKLLILLFVRSRMVPYIPLLLRGALRNSDLVPLIDVDPDDVAVPLHPVAPMWWVHSSPSGVAWRERSSRRNAAASCAGAASAWSWAGRSTPSCSRDRFCCSTQSISSAQLAKMGG